MKTTILVFLTILSLPGLALSTGGNYMGNGGDFLFCEKSTANDLSGYYSLDYVLTRGNSHLTIANISSLYESMQRIMTGLEKIPHLARSFRYFWESYKVKELHRGRIWEPAELELVDIKDEQILSPLIVPANCFFRSPNRGNNVYDSSRSVAIALVSLR